ncbi:MAG TPA: hypothetical protein VKR55_21415, partial [Bradyrhizobium sp.]|uniref:hypothetical protein n=1 Tax=Bradyrhizobium sp. TaxID=376 RepID=UPI002CD53BC9
PHRTQFRLTGCNTSIASRSTFVTIGRNAPLAGAGWAKQIMIFRKTEAKYFSQAGLTFILIKRSG